MWVVSAIGGAWEVLLELIALKDIAWLSLTLASRPVSTPASPSVVMTCEAPRMREQKRLRRPDPAPSSRMVLERTRSG